MPDLDADLWMPHHDFAEEFDHRHAEGLERLRHSSIAVVGLARNCGPQLADNLRRVEALGQHCKSWQLHIESNDCTDDTLDVLAEFSRRHSHATFHYEVLGRPHLPGEFAGRRTVALAEYRHACQQWVRQCSARSDYVIVMDFDLWAGFSQHGLVNGVGCLVEKQGAYGMASVSLFQYDFGNGPQWAHYDLWALRGVGQRDCYWDQYRGGRGGFGYTWMPPVGSPPALVSSAFGGMAIYRTDAYLAGTYDGTTDCEHVPFHQSIARATGQMLYVCPSMRTIVSWMEPCEATPQPSA
jgi:hypothetical protein